MKQFMPALCSLLLVACAGTSNETDLPDTDAEAGPCAYPDDPVEPMALDEVIYPYSWPVALHADGRSAAIDLNDVACATDEIIDWSVHDLLLFVSIPAW